MSCGAVKGDFSTAGRNRNFSGLSVSIIGNTDVGYGAIVGGTLIGPIAFTGQKDVV